MTVCPGTAGGSTVDRRDRRTPGIIFSGQAEEVSQDSSRKPPEDLALHNGRIHLDRSGNRLPIHPSGQPERRSREPEHVRHFLGIRGEGGRRSRAEGSCEHTHVEVEGSGEPGPDEPGSPGKVCRCESYFLLELPESRRKEVLVLAPDVAAGKTDLPGGRIVGVGGAHNEKGFNLDLALSKHENNRGPRGRKRWRQRRESVQEFVQPGRGVSHRRAGWARHN